MQEGNYKLVTDETPNLEKNQVLIRVQYSPVSQYDKACLNLCKSYEGEEDIKKKTFGTEGSGTIEEVGPEVD